MRRCAKDVRKLLKEHFTDAELVDEYVDEAMHGDGATVWVDMFHDVQRKDYAQAVIEDFKLYVANR